MTACLSLRYGAFPGDQRVNLVFAPIASRFSVARNQV